MLFLMLVKIILISMVMSAFAGSGPLNTFRVAPSSASLNDFETCGGTNITHSIACGTAPRLNPLNVQPNSAAFGEFPWQVAIVDSYEQNFLCSGVLLSHKTVMTAAHCVADVPVSDLRVRVGEWDILSDEDPRETYQSVEIPVSKKFFHPDMELTSDRMTEFHTVSLLKLRRSVNFGEMPHVAPACTPTPLQLDQLLPSLKCFVAGWSESPLQPLKTLVANRRGGERDDDDDSASETDMPRDKVTTRRPVEPTPKPSKSNNGYEDSACYANNSPRQRQQRQQAERERNMKQQRPSARSNNLKQDYDTEDSSEAKWSRILGKSQTRVVPRDECMTLASEIGELDPTSICLFPAEEYSHPCQADIGAAVVCEMPTYLVRNKRAKPDRSSREREDNLNPKQFSVVGIVTRSYSCSEMPSKANTMKKPVIATSILKILDQVCKVAGTTKKIIP